MSPINLGDYVEVKERVALFYEAWPEGRLVTDKVQARTDPDGKPRVWVKALAYRTPDDPHPGVGWSWLELPGSTPYTRGSEIENAETSAWGRAIGSLGIGIGRSIASRDEVDAKAGESSRPEVERDPLGGLIGSVEVRKPPADMELRQTPDGWAYGFGLVGNGGKGRIQVVALDALAEAIQLAGLKVGERVTVHGSVEFIAWKKAGKDMPPYQRLTLSRIETSEWTLPSPEPVDDDLSDLPDDLPLPLPETVA